MFELWVELLSKLKATTQQQEPKLTDECKQCGKIAGYHCVNCHSNIEDLKDQKLLKQHNAKCTNPLWINPLNEDTN